MDGNEKVVQPICPINLYFEGDEDICNSEKCDWDIKSRSCSSNCALKEGNINEMPVLQ